MKNQSITRSIINRVTRRFENSQEVEKRSLVMDALEPRVLFSGSPAPAPEPAPESAPAQEAPAPDSAPAAEQTSDSDSQVAAPPEATSGDDSYPTSAGADTAVALTDAEIQAVAEVAAQRWADSGISEEQQATLTQINYQIVDLDGDNLGAAQGSTISIDVDAAGRGWFVDSTPLVDEEFDVNGVTLEADGGEASSRIDLLTALLHEQGHILGLDHGSALMLDILGTGERRLPAEGQADGSVPLSLDGVSYLTAADDPGPVGFSTIWKLGTDNGSFNEFAHEANPDEHYYFAGSYPSRLDGNPDLSPATDEPLNTIDRVLIGGDPTNFFHFNLTEDQLKHDFVFDLDALLSGSPHDLTVKFNGITVHTETNITSNGLIRTPSFNGVTVGATTGDNVLEITKSGGAGNYIGLDFIRLLSKPVSDTYFANEDAALAVNLDPVEQDFDGGGANSVFTEQQVGTAPAGAVTGGGPTGSFYRLTNNNVNGQNNAIAFDRTLEGPFTGVNAQFDFRLNGGGSPADGFGFVLLSTDQHGISGDGPGFTAEEPSIPGSLGVGFDLHPAPLNEVSLHFDGSVRQTNNIPVGSVDLDAAVFHRAIINVVPEAGGGSRVSVSIIPDVHGAPGAAIDVFSDVLIADLDPYEARVMFRGRTGGLNTDVDLDNINVVMNGLLANDTEFDSIISSDSTSTNGTSVAVVGNGSFTYDASGSPVIQALAEGDMLTDTFTYTIADSFSVGAGPTTWDFDPTNGLDGWTVLNGGAMFRTNDGGGMAAANSSTNSGFGHDAAHETFLVESPDFRFDGSTLDGTNAISVNFVGGQGSQGGSVGAFSTPGDVVAFNGGDATANGLKAVALYNTSTGQYDATLFDPGNGGGIQTVTLPETSVSEGVTYRLHFYDNDSGGWGWTQLNDVTVAGGLATPGATDTATVSVEVTGVNDAPVAIDNTAIATEDTALSDSGNVLTDDDGSGVDFDVDSPTTLRVTEVDGVTVDTNTVINGTHGDLTISGDGSYTYDLDNAAAQSLGGGDSVTDSFDYTIFDGDISWNFSNDLLNGWTVLNGVENFSGNGITAGQSGGGFAHDAGHETFLVESPVFQFDGTTLSGGNALIIDFDGGQGNQSGHTAVFTNPGEVTAFNGGNSASNGLKAVALLNTTTGQYEATLFDPSNGGGGTATLSAGSVSAGVDYRLHFYENDEGSWGWTRLNRAQVAGTLANPKIDTGTLRVTITGANDAPDATNDAYSAAEDDGFAVLGNVLTDNTGAGADSDVDGDTFTVTSVDTTGTLGIATVGPNGDFTYDPNGQFEYLAAGETATDTFTYTIEDTGVTVAPGLVAGTVSGSFNTTDANPGNVGVSLDLSEANNGIAGNTTEVYTGQFFDADGIVSFREHIDDATWLRIDGQVVLNNGQWNVETNSGTLNLTPGWVDFELRVGNGGGGAGPVGGIGFEYDPEGGTNWSKIQDGAGSAILRHQVTSPATDTATVTVTVTGVNDAPVASNDTGYTTAEDTVLNVPTAGTTAQPASSLVLAQDPLLYYRMDETGGTTADNQGSLGAAADGSLIGDTAPGSVGQVNGAFSFDGSGDYISTGATASELGIQNGSFTASAWVNPDATNNDRTIFGTDQTGGNQGLHLIIRNGKAHFGFFGNDTGGNATIPTGQWTHLTWVYDSAAQTQSIYVNGVLDNSTGGHGAFTGNDTINVGRWAGNRYFDGLIDEAAIVGGVLTGTQIADIYNAGHNDGLLANDTDPDFNGTGSQPNDTLTVTGVGGGGLGTAVALASGATVTGQADGSFAYDPNGSFEFLAVGETTTDTFTYTMTDGPAFVQNFDAFTDGTSGTLPDGSEITTNSVGSIQGGQLQLTRDDTGSTTSAYRIPALDGSSQGWNSTFDVTLQDAAGEGIPADGFSFSYGAIPPTGFGSPAEEGWGGAVDHIAFEFDTYPIGSTENGYNITVNGADVAFLNTDILADGATGNLAVEVSWNPVTGASLSVNGTAIFAGVATPGFVGSDAYTFAFAARTGGADETVLIDNVALSVTDTATATVTITGVNDAPVASDDTYSSDEDTVLTVAPEDTLLDNDYDTDQILVANFADFSDVSDFTLNGNAAQSGSVLRLTPAANSQGGSAFLTDPLPVHGGTSFKTQFDFQLTGGSGDNGADGIAFVLQSQGVNALGGLGGGLGYSGVSPSVAVVFDSHNETGYNLGIRTNGSGSNNIASTPNGSPIDYNDPATGVVTAWVEYDAVTDLLEVFVSADGTKPAAATLSATLDIDAILGENAFVGFTAATGGATNNQDILNWTMTATEPLTVVNSQTTSTGGAAVTANPDGTFTYDPTGTLAIQALDDLDVLNDTFTYTVSDGHADGLFNITAFAADPGGGSNDNDLNSTTETLGIWDAIDGGATVPGSVIVGAKNYNVARYETSTAGQVLYNGDFDGFTGTVGYNTIGGGSITGGDDFSVRAQTYIQFDTAGSYSISAGSDDGRRIELTEAEPGSAPGFSGFTAQGDQTTGSVTPNVVYFDGTTGHAHTTGVFTVGAGDILALDAFFFERGGGDSFHVSIKNSADNGHGGTGDGWQLLADGAFGVKLSSTKFFSVATANVTINGLNDAPVLTGTNDFDPVAMDDVMNGGQMVSELVGDAFGDFITDVDDSAVEGIAITANTTSGPEGTFQYSTDGGTAWTDVGAVSDFSALLLRDTDFVRYLPNAGGAATGALTFKAWDQAGATAGQQGTKVTTLPDGSTEPTAAFSEDTATADAAIVNVLIEDGVLIYGEGEGREDLVTISSDGSFLTIHDDAGPVVAADPAWQVDPNTVEIPLTEFEDIEFRANDLDDTITIGDMAGFDGSLTIDGEEGFDSVTFAAGMKLALGTGLSDGGADENLDVDAETVKIDFDAALSVVGDGTIDIAATGGGAEDFIGLQLKRASLTSADGSITLVGEGGSVGNHNDGVQINVGSTITTAGGSVGISGTGTGTSGPNDGVSLVGGSDVTVGGAGTITITGSSSGAGDSNGVLLFSGTEVTTAGGDISVAGVSAGTGARNSGIYTNGATVAAGGAGSISLDGEGGGTGSHGKGLRLTASSFVASGTGDITLAGTGGPGTRSNVGVEVGVRTSLATGSGDVTVTGEGGGTASQNTGVAFLSGSSVDSGGGITVAGTGGDGTSNNDGVSLISATLEAAGDISVTGEGAGGGNYNRGIDSTRSSIGGAGVTLTGTGTQSGGTSARFGDGVYLNRGGASASGTLTIAATGGTGSSNNRGFYASGVTLGGTLAVTGTADAGTTGRGNSGVYILNSVLGAGTVEGTAGGGTGSFGAHMNNITGGLAPGDVTGNATDAEDELVGNFFNVLPALVLAAGADRASRRRKAVKQLSGLIAKLGTGESSENEVSIYREEDGHIGLDPVVVTLEALSSAGVEVPQTPEGGRVVLLLTGGYLDPASGFFVLVDARGELVDTGGLEAEGMTVGGVLGLAAEVGAWSGRGGSCHPVATGGFSDAFGLEG